MAVAVVVAKEPRGHENLAGFLQIPKLRGDSVYLLLCFPGLQIYLCSLLSSS